MDENQNTEDLSAEDAAFAAGFASVAGGDEQPPATTSEPGDEQGGADDAGSDVGQSTDDSTAGDETATEATAAEQAAETEDELANLPQPLRAALEKLSGLDQLAARLRNVEGHVGGINSQIKQLASKPVPQAPAASDTPQGMSGEKWQRLQDEFPEIADALAEQLQRMPQAGQGNGLSLEQVEQRIEQARREVQLDLIEERHPSWQQELQTEHGQRWLQTLTPEEVHAFRFSERAVEVNGYLDRFKQFREQQHAATRVQSQRDLRARNAVTPTGGAKAGGARRNEPTEDDAFAAGFASVRGG